MKFRHLGILLAGCLCFPVAHASSLRMPLVFSSGAVLQRGQPLRVWGWAAPGDHVDVALDGSAATATVGKDGRWKAILPRHAAGGPYTLSVVDGAQRIDIPRVMVGDVWLCSGQSNMEFTVSEVRDAAAEIARANDPDIRQFKVPRSASLQPQSQLAGGSWVDASPATVGKFSAVCWFFARDMQARTHVAQGLINSSWGGSSIQAWTDAVTGHFDMPKLARELKAEAAVEDRRMAAARRQLARWPAALAADDAAVLPAETGTWSGWAAPGLDTADWARIPVPAYWETKGYYDMDGLAWYRTSFTLDAAQTAQGITLGLGEVDDSDRSYVNGHLVGATSEAWNKPRVYTVPARFLHAGRNVIAVRVDDLGAGGGIHGSADALYVQYADGTRHPLAGQWLFRPQAVYLTRTDMREIKPAILYNAMIHPLLGYPLRGIIWYQGEANALAHEARSYATRFKTLIRVWRKQWSRPRLPFIWVQLANFKAGEDTAQYSPWAELRAAQTSALALPETGQAITIDIGSTDTIHPTDKQDVGHRLALVARRLILGDKVIDSGPVFRSMQVEGSSVRIHFATQGQALAVRGGGDRVGGFELAGADMHYKPAQARIVGHEVVVGSADVKHPVAVRYAWSEDPVDADLIGQNGLPAGPFRDEVKR
ncbi:sialate O-acetylesterase [Dyella sp. A6]|uniref:sialate O-acetylesterase n=1 Tax=Dyella aluminiiresistens TaxID=3069105 RepID=UPI002E791F34|nr:sialate O-acetylesterase [Dyella sp. A6]